MGDLPSHVRIREVGPRDGFQNEPEVLPTDVKIRLIELLGATGVRRLEVTSFVRADVIPQLPRRRGARVGPSPGARLVGVLIPNERGLDNALVHRPRFDEVSGFLSASETHNQHNVGRSVADSLAGLARVYERSRAEGLRCVGVISTSFGCPYEGRVPVERVLEVASSLAAAGAAEVGFGDTTGMANPVQVGDSSSARGPSSPVSS